MSLASSYPLLIRAYNRVMPVKAIEAEKLAKAVQKSTGLNDFGEAAYLERLQRLCTAMNAEAKLHPFGVFMSKERLKGLLKNRLLAVDLLKRHPEILEQELLPPIFITGLQRTGTTFLQRLLAADHKNNRALLSWEVLNPIPLQGKNEQQKRIGQARMSQRALRYISPVFFSIHPVEYNSPEEDVLLNDMSLLSAVPEAIMDVPSFSEWVTKQDHGIAYDWLIKMLKILQWKTKAKTWILKTPQHLEYMDVIAQKFPTATVIHTHRSPKECIPSFCSMVYHSRKVFSEQVDALASAEHWINKNIYMLQKTIRVRQDNPSFKVLDVHYNDLVKDPTTTIQSIYQQLDIPWNTDTTASLQKALGRNKKDKYGKHHYDKADFGLSDASINQKFSFYLDYYNLK